MTIFKAFLIGTACLSVAACNTRGDRFDNEVDLSASAIDPSASAVAVGPAPNTAEYFQQTVGDRVLFEVDQSSLTAEGMRVLDAQAAWLATHTDFVAVIEGHADEQGTREYNLGLGARRSNAVKEYLVSKGIPDGRLRVVSFGKERPIEICSEEACYAKNRRAVTILSGGATS